MFKKKTDFNKKWIITYLFIFILLFSFFINNKNANAQMVTMDPTGLAQQMLDYAIQTTQTTEGIKKTIWDKILEQLKKVGANLYQTTLTTALNTFAYDAANYIATADKGKPLFPSDYLTEYAKKMGDVAISEFVETISKDWQIDLCRPGVNARINMGLGLVSSSKPSPSVSCSWQEMKSNWQNEYDKWADIYNDEGNSRWKYIDSVAKSFHPTGNDVTIALNLFEKKILYPRKKIKKWQNK